MEVVDLPRQTRVFQLLGRASSSLLGRRPLPELFERVLDVVFEAVPVERGAIVLLEPRQRRAAGRAPRAAARASRSRASAGAISRRVVEQRVALLIPNILDDDSLQAHARA